MSERVYLDYNATAPLRPEARDALRAALDAPANPSSVHAEGRRARALVETARADIAGLVGSAPADVTFVGSATEAAAQLLATDWLHEGQPRAVSRLYASGTEHPCILAGGRLGRAGLTALPVDGQGRVDLAALDAALARHDAGTGAALVAVQAANNETGVLQPVAEAAAIARRHGAILVCDAVQAAGRIPLEREALGADALFISSHKLGGPAGAGAIVLRGDTRPAPLLTGGGQERGLRAGTENVAAIAGFGAAARAAANGLPTEAARLFRLRQATEAAIRHRAPDAAIFAEKAPRLPNTICFAKPDVRAETLLMALDLADVAVSSGSACSSGKVGRSHVLAAMGVEAALAAGAIRLSLGWNSTEADIDRFATAFEAALATLDTNRKRRAA